MSPEREKEIRAEFAADYPFNRVGRDAQTCRDLLAALDEARKERDELARVLEMAQDFAPLEDHAFKRTINAALKPSRERLKSRGDAPEGK